MIETNFTMEEWFKMIDEEQCKICIALVNEYEIVKKPFLDRLWSDRKSHVINAEIAYMVAHDWEKTRSNLAFIAQPSRGNMQRAGQRWNTFWTLYNICGLLEYINKQFLGVENGKEE